MAKDERAVAITEDIKLVLGVLNMRYPSFVSGETVFRAVLAVSTDYTKTRLLRDMTYLNEKGYVKFRGLNLTEPRTITVNGCAFALTDDGFEIANRLRGDDALDV